MLGIVLSAGNIAMNKTGIPAFMKLTFLSGKTD